MKKITLLIAFFMVIITGSYGQSASTYSFSSSLGTYADNSAAATLLPLVRADSYISPAQNIGFTFAYEGVNYTQFKMSSNGFISFSSGAAVTLNTNDFSSTNAPSRPIIAPLWDDLDGSGPASSVAGYELTGVAPNRVLTVEWRNWEWNYSSTTPVISFQVKLYETTNVIEYVYRQESTAVVPGSASIGIGSATGTGSGSYLNLTSVATPAVSSTVSTTGIITKPATGQIFTFTPPVPCSGTPVVGTLAPVVQNLCSGATPASINASGYTGVTGYIYQWEESNDNGVGDAWANAVGGTGATTSSYTPPTFSGTTIYYRLNVTCTNSALSSQTASVSIDPPVNPTTQITAVTIPSATVGYNQAVVNWTIGNGSRRAVFISDSATFTDPVNGNGPALTANTVYAGTGQQLIFNNTGTSVTVTGLASGVTYYIKAYEYTRCGSGPYDHFYNVSTGTNIGTFTTCGGSNSVPTIENFATFLPGCWMEADNGDLTAGPATFGASSWDVDGFGNVGTTGAIKYNVYTTLANDWVLSPFYTIPASGYELKFDAAAVQYNATTAPSPTWGPDDSVQVLVSNGTTNWTVLYTYDSTNQPSNIGTTNIIDLDAYAGQNVRFAFRALEGTTDQPADIDFSIDNFQIRLTPACPDPTSLVASNVTHNSADIAWTGTSGNYEYVLDQVATAPAGAGTATTLATYSAASLTPVTTYYFHVRSNCAGIFSAWATVSFTTSTAPLANDNFANATPISCGSNYTGNTTTATLDEDNAPDGFGADMDARNVWYSFTGSGAAQTVTLNLCGSSYDSSVLVYTGTSGNLTLLAANDDDATCSISSRSKVSFTSNGTTTYYIAIEGYNASSYGAYTMDVTCAAVIPPAVANQDCATSLVVNVDGSDTASDNSYGTVSPVQPSCDPFGSVQDVWFSFVAPSSGAVDCLLTRGTMTSLNFNIYSGTCAGLTPVSSTCNSDLTAPTTESLTGLTVGNTYYVQVWSNAAEQGTFTLRLTDTALDTPSFDTTNFMIYPNPVKDVLNLSYSKNISTVSIHNLLGQEVMSKNINASQSKIDMTNLPSGTYLVKVTVDNLVKTVKIVKE